jgi:hypothetical protein
MIEIELELRSRTPGVEPVNVARIDFTKYQNDPVAFGVEVLGEYYTPDVIDLMNSVKDFGVTVARSANAVGKTHCAARIALWFYKCFPDAQIYTAAAPPESNLRRLLWGEIGSLVHKHPELFEGEKTNTLNIERDSHSFITGVTIPMAGTPEQREAKFNGKHAPNLLFIVDEGDAVPPEVYRGIEACMSGGNAHLLVMFNPRGASGPVYQMERDHTAHIVEMSAFRHPNVTTGEDVIPGAVSREKTVRRLNEWSRPLAEGELPDTECFELPEFLVGVTGKAQDGHEYAPLPAGTRKITNPAFSYMVLGNYPPQSELQLISRTWIEAAVVRWLSYVATYGEMPPPSIFAIMGYDVAEYGKDKNVLAIRYGGWVARFAHTWQGVDPDTGAIEAAKVYHQIEAENCAVDATGVGAGVPARMGRLGCNADGVKVASSPTYETELGAFGTLRDQLWWSLREWFRTDPGAMIPPEEELLEELATPSYGVINGKIKVTDKDTMREMLGRSPNYADALALTFAPEGIGHHAEYGENPLNDFRG